MFDNFKNYPLVADFVNFVKLVIVVLNLEELEHLAVLAFPLGNSRKDYGQSLEGYGVGHGDLGFDPLSKAD